MSTSFVRSKKIVLSGIIFPSLLFLGVHFASANTNQVNIWWPTNNATVSGSQPFKVVLENRSLNEYSMYWQVDNGGLVKMDDNQTDYPHKESLVDVSNWKWNSNGVYNIMYIAKDTNGNEISRTSETLNVNTPSASVAVTVSPTPQVDILWPTNNANVAGVQTVKAVISGKDISSYKIFWSLNGGQKNELPSAGDNSHKEGSIDFTNWTWMGNQAYVLTFTAVDNQNTILSEKKVSVYTNSQAVPAPATQTSAPIAVVPVSPSGALYVNQSSPALTQANLWQSTRPIDAAIMQKIGSQSVGVWYGGWNTNLLSDIQKVMLSAASTNSIPTLVAYNIPGRDCQGYSAGGASSMSAYNSWIKTFSQGVGSGKAIVILEPDALSNITCLSQSMQSDRYAMIQNAVNVFKANNPNAKVYVDAGHAGWIDATEMSTRLNKAGVQNASGFSLNVSNYVSTLDNTTYGQTISNLTNSAHFVIDTSRNGNGSNGEWCNASGRSLGQAPTLSTGVNKVDGYLWVKPVGESDGNCNGGPSAGVWWADYALDMAKRAGY